MKAVYLSVNVFITKVLILLGTLFSCLLLETGPPFYVVICLAACREKVVPSFLSYFKTLSIGPVPGIEPMTSCCTDKCSTDRANPAAVKKSKNIVKKIIKYCQKAVAVVMHALCPFERKWSLSLIMINFVSHFHEVSWNFSDVIVFISVWVTKLSQKVNQLLKIRVIPLFFIFCVGILYCIHHLNWLWAWNH